IGLAIVVAWGAIDLARLARIPDRVPAAIGAAAIVILAAMAFHQVGYWHDSEKLFAHTIAVTPPNSLAEYTLGQGFEMTAPERAITHLRRALEIIDRTGGSNPAWHAQVYVGLGTALMMRARPLPIGAQRTATINEAVAQFQQALSIDPNAPHAKNNIALAQQWLGERASRPQ